MANSTEGTTCREPARYQIRIKGKIRENWSDWLHGMDISIEGAEEGSPVTTVAGLVPDQAALRGILCKFWDLNLTILSVMQIESKAGEKGEENE